MAHIYLPKDLTTKEYLNKKLLFLKKLSPYALFRNGYAEEFYPFPIVHTKKELAELKRLQKVLACAVEVLVENYFHDAQISDRVPLNKTIRKELEKIRHLPYETGGIRPDYIYAEDGTVKVCEINARFIFNAFYMSAYANTAFSKCYPQFTSLDGLNVIPRKFKGHFSKDKKVAVVKGREEGYDIHTFLLENSNAQLLSVNHIDVALSKYQSVVLELHQDELEPNLEKVCAAMRDGVRVVNDPRTLFIVHDKRLLAVLSNRHIMKKYLSKTDIDILMKHVIPTYIKKCDAATFTSAQSNKDKWVAKKAISGKADGLYLGKEEGDTWRKVLAREDTLLQPYIVQKEFTLWDPFQQKNSAWYIAGTLPLWNGEPLGPGLYRVYPTRKHKFSRFIQPLAKTT